MARRANLSKLLDLAFVIFRLHSYKGMLKLHFPKSKILSNVRISSIKTCFALKIDNMHRDQIRKHRSEFVMSFPLDFVLSISIGNSKKMYTYLSQLQATKWLFFT